MHKRVLHLFLLIVAALAAVFSFTKYTKAEDSSLWVNSPLAFQNQGDTQSIPTSLNGNIDCSNEDLANCSVATTYGVASQNSSARLFGTKDFHPVYSYIDNHTHFIPIPDSNSAISYTTEQAFGFYLYFNYNLSVDTVLRNGSLEYDVNKPPDGVLADQTNHRLAADYTSMSFSPSSQWLVVSDPNVAMLRVDLHTFQVLPFAPGFNYSIGLDSSIKTAITNDGRYAVVASKNFNFFKIYDLSTCDSTPSTISGPDGCQSRDLTTFMQQQLPGFSFIDYARFLDDDTLSLYATYTQNGLTKTAGVLIGSGSINNQIDYLALGDSYISGEGAFDYQGGTDNDTNRCHLSLISYPYFLGHDLNYNSYHSVACSGAVTDDIINTSSAYAGQADDKKVSRKVRNDSGQTQSIENSFKPGYIDQMDFVSRFRPKAITLSVGGNDMGFSPILKSCAQGLGTCYTTYEDRLELIREINDRVFPKLVQTYQKLKNSGPANMRFYVIGYPQIAKPGGNCALNVHLNNDEIIFSQQIISYLDAVIQQGSEKAGVYYVDTQDALNGHRLCEAGPGSVAMNGLTAGNDRPGSFGGPIGDESYHPNDFGYQLLENKILIATHNLNAAMPLPNPAASAPSENNLEILNTPRSNRAVNVSEYDSDIAGDSALPGSAIAVNVAGQDHGLAPGSTLQAELHSNPVSLGSFSTDGDDNLSAQITLPASLPAGYHELHFFGTDMAGQPIDIYKLIYIDDPASNDQKCGGVEMSGQDFDQDGIDDACDGTIGLPPSSPSIELSSAGAQISGTLSSPDLIVQGNQTATENPISSANTKRVTGQQPAGQVLSDSTEAAAKDQFRPGWLLALIPATLSIAYFFSSRY